MRVEIFLQSLISVYLILYHTTTRTSGHEHNNNQSRPSCCCVAHSSSSTAVVACMIDGRYIARGRYANNAAKPDYLFWDGRDGSARVAKKVVGREDCCSSVRGYQAPGTAVSSTGLSWNVPQQQQQLVEEGGPITNHILHTTHTYLIYVMMHVSYFVQQQYTT